MMKIETKVEVKRGKCISNAIIILLYMKFIYEFVYMLIKLFDKIEIHIIFIAIYVKFTCLKHSIGSSCVQLLHREQLENIQDK